MDLDRKLDEELAFSHEKTSETNATKSHQSHVIQCPSMSMKFHQLPIETHENPPSLLVKFTSLRPGHGALAFALGSPFCRCQSHGGYPQFSSIYRLDFQCNHPAIGVPPWLWKPWIWIWYVAWFTGSINKLERYWICFGFVSYVFVCFLFLRCHEISSRHGKDTT